MSLSSLPIPQLPSSLPKGNVNWKAVVFWAVVLGLAGAAVWWFYGDQIQAWILKPQLPNIDLSTLTLDNVIQFAKDYGFLITGGVAAFTFIYGLYQKHKSNALADAKAELELQKIQGETVANEQIKTLQTSVNSYKYQYEQAIANTNTEALTEAQNLVAAKEAEIKGLKIALDQANDKLTSIPYREVEKYK